jgi:predicted CopG family antitoxin
MVLLTTLSKSVKVSLSEEQYNHLRKLANKQNESVSALIREMLENLLLQKKVTDEKPKRRLCDHEAYGIWADRDDMVDSLEWVRKQRESWKDRLSRIEQ